MNGQFIRISVASGFVPPGQAVQVRVTPGVGPQGPAVPLSDNTPAAIAYGGEGTPGTSTSASPSDHVHPLPALPLGTTSTPGILQPDGTTILVTGGVISAVGGGEGGGVESVTSTSSALMIANPTTTPAITPVFGAGANTFAQGNDSRIVDALQSGNNLSDVDSATAARMNLGLGTAATEPTSAFDPAGAADAAVVGLAVDSTVVHLAGTETITGAKTFSLSPQVPTPAANDNTANSASTKFVTTAISTAMAVVTSAVLTGISFATSTAVTAADTILSGIGKLQAQITALVASLAPSATTDTTNASNISSGTLAAARGGAGTINGLLKANGSGVTSQATAGTDYVIPTGNISGTSGGTTANAVTNAMLAQAPTLTLKGNNTGSTANEADLTVAQVQSMLAIVATNLANQFTQQQSVTPARGTMSGAVSINLANLSASTGVTWTGSPPTSTNNLNLTLTGNVSSFAFTNPADGGVYNIRFIQDSTGSRTMPALTGGVFKWSSGAGPTFSTAAGAVDFASMEYGATEGNYMSSFLPGMA